MSIVIVLQDRAGQQLELVDWQIGKKLVKFGFAKVLCKTPCTIKLACKTELYEELKVGVRQWRRIRRSPIYGNVQFQSSDGVDMFRNGYYKAFWYLARNLVFPVSQNPPVFRFIYKTKGDGNSGDPFYLAPKKNVCVVCGSLHSKKTKHTRHHVFPHMFRRHMNELIKAHSYHDIVILCKKCHSEYEIYADQLKETLYDKYEVPREASTNKFIVNTSTKKAKSLAIALIKHGHKMSCKTEQEVRRKLQNLIDEPLCDETIKRLADSCVQPDNNKDYVDLGKWIADRVNDVQAFVVMWRRHFVDCMNPKHMPELWDINRPISREKC